METRMDLIFAYPKIPMPVNIVAEVKLWGGVGDVPQGVTRREAGKQILQQRSDSRVGCGCVRVGGHKLLV